MEQENRWYRGQKGGTGGTGVNVKWNKKTGGTGDKQLFFSF